MRIFLLAFLSLSLSGLFAQETTRCSFKTPHQADNWLFFQNIGLKFTDAGTTINHPTGNNLFVGKGTAAISDENGELLFYTDGMKVWNGEHIQINAGPNLSGNLGSTQSSLIAPRPNSENDYYIFTTDVLDNSASNGSYSYLTSGFNFSRVDVSFNNNQGAVSSERDIQLLSESAEMISGVKHANGIDYWVVTHGLKGNNFYAFLVDSSGVNQTAVVSPIGSEFERNGEIFINKRDYLGAMKISPNGKKIAYASYGKKMIEVFSFDNRTGTVSDLLFTIEPEITDPENRGPYYVEFSPDGTKLYYTIVKLTAGENNILYQYDLETGEQSDPLNDPSPPFYPDVTAMQLARDGKIYVGRLNKSKLGVIENPNRSGTSCKYKQDGLDLGSKNAQMGMPNFIQSYFDIPHFDYDTKCEGDETMFSLLNESNIYEATWDFDDPDNAEVGTGLNPVHVFSKPGEYMVKLTEKFDNEEEEFITRIPVTIHPLPAQPLAEKGESMFLFPGSRVPLDAGEGMFSYDWRQGLDYSTDQIFEVDQPGVIEVTVEDIYCCSNSKSLEVISLAITLPNAFTPNGDDWNQEFFAFGPRDGIENFNLKVFNLWGQMVWEAKNFDQKWDGTVKGQSAPTGLYTWLLGFDIIGDLTGIGRVKYKGTVTLLR